MRSTHLPGYYRTVVEDEGLRFDPLHQHLRPHTLVRYIFSYAGGTAPFIVQRFDLLDATQVVPGGEIRGKARDQFRRFDFDAALVYQKPVVSLTSDGIGTIQFVFGSDHPYSMDMAAGAATAINSADYISPEDRAAIGWQNAQRLLPRLAG